VQTRLSKELSRERDGRHGAAPIASWGELNVPLQNRAAIGGFDESGSHPAGLYLSSSQLSDNHTWGQRFSEGYQFINFKYVDSVSAVGSLRGWASHPAKAGRIFRIASTREGAGR
jgi:hypothetical protein